MYTHGICIHVLHTHMTCIFVCRMHTHIVADEPWKGTGSGQVHQFHAALVSEPQPNWYSAAGDAKSEGWVIMDGISGSWPVWCQHVRQETTQRPTVVPQFVAGQWGADDALADLAVRRRSGQGEGSSQWELAVFCNEKRTERRQFLACWTCLKIPDFHSLEHTFSLTVWERTSGGTEPQLVFLQNVLVLAGTKSGSVTSLMWELFLYVCQFPLIQDVWITWIPGQAPREQAWAC